MMRSEFLAETAPASLEPMALPRRRHPNPRSIVTPRRHFSTNEQGAQGIFAPGLEPPR